MNSSQAKTGTWWRPGSPDRQNRLTKVHRSLRKKKAIRTRKRPERKPLPPHIKESKDPISVIVVADVDVLADRTWLTAQNLLGQRIVVPFANNADFAINMLDNFTGSKELITLRGGASKSARSRSSMIYSARPKFVTVKPSKACKRSLKSCKRNLPVSKAIKGPLRKCDFD